MPGEDNQLKRKPKEAETELQEYKRKLAEAVAKIEKDQKKLEQFESLKTLLSKAESVNLNGKILIFFQNCVFRRSKQHFLAHPPLPSTICRAAGGYTVVGSGGSCRISMEVKGPEEARTAQHLYIETLLSPPDKLHGTVRVWCGSVRIFQIY